METTPPFSQRSNYVRRNEPFVCRQHCLAHQQRTWWDDDDHLKQMEEKAMIRVRVATPRNTTTGRDPTHFQRYGEGAYGHANMTLLDFLDYHDQTDKERYRYETLYASQIDLLRLPRLRKYLPQFSVLDAIGQSAQETIYIGQGAKTQLHYDSQENWVCVLSGNSKSFVLYDPITSAALLYLDAEQYRNTSPVDDEQEDIYVKYPMARYALPVRVTLHAGDCLYLPIYWFHEVITGSRVRSISVNWWRHPTNKEGHHLTIALWTESSAI